MRVLPYAFVKRALQRLNASGQPAIMYVHPWELDVEQDYPHVTARERITHYHGRRGLEAKLRKLFSDFRFTSLGELYRTEGAGALRAPGTSLAYSADVQQGCTRRGVRRGCGMRIRELAPRTVHRCGTRTWRLRRAGCRSISIAWRDVMHDVYGYETLYLAAEAGEPGLSNGAGSHLVGVLPLYVVASPLVGEDGDDDAGRTLRR